MKRDKVLAAGATASVLGAAVALAFVLGSGSDTTGGSHGKDAQTVRAGASNGAPVNAAVTATCKHNPLKNTKLELKVDPNKVAPGDQVTFTGTLLGEGDKNCPAAGRTVQLYIAGKSGNPDTSIGTTNTDSDGSFSFAYNPLATNDFLAKWVGDGTYPPDTSNKVHVDVKPSCKHYPPKKAQLELKVTPNKVAPGGQVTFYGNLTGQGDKDCGAPNRTVQLFIAGKDHNPDTPIGSASTDADGNFTFPYNPTATNDYIARWAGDTTYPPDTSNKVHVDVKP